MAHEQDEFADFYRASRDTCLRAVTAVVGDRLLAEEQVAKAFARACPGQLKQPSTVADGSPMVLDSQAIPPGTRLSIGLFPNYVRMLLIKDGAPLTCSSTSDQPAVHVPRSGTPIHQ